MSIRSKLLDAFSKFKKNNAIFVDDVIYSYGELFEYSCRSARGLLNKGFSGNSGVILMGMRNYHTYGGIIGTILAGGYYVPTNPHFPTDRNLKIISRSGARYAFFDTAYEKEYADVLKSSSSLVIFTGKDADISALMASYPNHSFYRISDFDCDLPTIKEPLPSDFIYLLFTSGSTGEPKGVAINDKNVESYVLASILRYPVSERDRFIQLFDLTFDLSAHNIFLAFCSGACLYVPKDGELMNPVKFAAEHRITSWASVPSVLAILEKLRALRENILPDIRYSMFCGEGLPYELTAKWNAAAPNSVIENLYGPTEATIACIYHKFDRLFSEKYSINGLVPIGVAFEGMKTLVVDDGLKPVKKGEFGELLLSGLQLAAGYFKDEVKTKEKFINIGGGIYYRTGDIVKENDAGYVYVGRIDTQIKIMGYRIELSEVEHVASVYTKTSNAVALPLGDAAKGYTGIAIFLRSGEWDLKGLMQAFKDKLPFYMVPSKVKTVDDFPLNSNGKIDRNKLKELI